MAREMLGVVMIMGLLMAMVPNTMQLRLPHSDLDGPCIGLVLSSASDEQLLLESGLFVLETSIKKAGRTFNVGTFKGVPTVYVVALSPLAHVSTTVQIMIDNFHIVGIIDYGNAASVSPSLKLADVAVMSETAYTSSWIWEKFEGAMEASELPALRIGDYNVPEAGGNKLASLQYEKINKYTPKGVRKTFWYYIDPQWLEIASQLKNINLENCIGSEYCIEDVPSVKIGVRGSSSDVYLKNEAYGKFLHDELDVSTVDRKSAATVSTAVANGVKHIVFRAASNKPGIPQDQAMGNLARKNNLKVVSEFVELIANQLPLIKHYY